MTQHVCHECQWVGLKVDGQVMTDKGMEEFDNVCPRCQAPTIEFPEDTNVD